MKILGRTAAALCAAALVVLAAMPALAATHRAQASGSALTLTLGGSPNGTGTFTATNDGSGEHTSGTNQPAISVLGGQDLISQGTLHQDATARVTDGSGHSAACAGLAGQGATLVSVGEARCLTGGQTLSLDAGHLDLSHVTLASGTALQGVPTGQIPLSQLTGPVGDALAQALDQMGNPAVAANLGAIRAHCAADTSRATGDSELANAKVTLTPPGQPAVTLVTLPVHPRPNTRITADTNVALDAILDAFKADLTQSLNGQLAPLGQAVDPIKQQVSDNAVKQLTTQLKPLLDNIVTGMLNAQSHPTADSIDVTALDLTLLPAAGAQSPRLQVGHVTCGPNGQAAPTPRIPVKTPQLPTVVNSGLASAPGTTAHHHVGAGLLAFGGVLVLSGGMLLWRRVLISRA